MLAIKVADFAYPRMEAPDLDADGGIPHPFRPGPRRAHTGSRSICAAPTATIICTSPHKGGTKFIGFAYHAADEDDLKRIAKLPGASGIETLDEPGGGKRVRLTEPNGYQIEVIAGMRAVAPIKVERDLINTGSEPQRRAGRVMRLAKSPTTSSASATACWRRPRSRRRWPGSATRWA